MGDEDILFRLLSGLGVNKMFANGVDFDILCVIHIHELFIDVRAVNARHIQVWVVLARLVRNLVYTSPINSDFLSVPRYRSFDCKYLNRITKNNSRDSTNNSYLAE